jgi:uncharacterized protein (DUF2147 family)
MRGRSYAIAAAVLFVSSLAAVAVAADEPFVGMWEEVNGRRRNSLAECLKSI